MKQGAKSSGIIVQTLLKSKEQIPEHDYGGMSDQAIVIAQLNFLFQFQIRYRVGTEGTSMILCLSYNRGKGSILDGLLPKTVLRH